MRYDDPQLQDMLAAEYALGALRGTARARFETLARRDPALSRRVVEWQERLAPLAQEIPEVSPPPRVLAELRRRIKPVSPRWWNRIEFWRPFGAVSALLVVVLTIYLGVQIMQPSTSADPRYVAVLADNSERPAVVVTAYANPWRLNVESLRPVKVKAGSVLRIWAVDRSTGARRRLAEFAPGETRRVALSKAGWGLVKTAESLIVSEEPIHIASTQPTGRILYSGPCINLKGTGRS